MAKKKSDDERGPSKAYLVSFGDTMTTLLAFFIVLNSLAEEQTGANLHAGTGSFMQAMQSFGVRGIFRDDYTSAAVSHQATNPLYIGELPEDADPASNPSGPDPLDNGLRVIDREAEQFQRFVNEMERISEIKPQPTRAGEVKFDFYTPLNKQPPLLTEPYRAAFANILPILRRPEYRVTMTVWASTPTESAWTRAIDQARQTADEIGRTARLAPDAQNRLQAEGKPWLFSDVQRPVLSLEITKLADEP